MIDEENSSKVVGSFCIIMPQEIAAKLRTMSNNIEENLEEITSMSEELNSIAQQL